MKFVKFWRRIAKCMENYDIMEIWKWTYDDTKIRNQS